MVRKFAITLFFLALPNCGSLDPAQTCGEIPLDGCPTGRGGTCDDPYCAALYDCVDGAWTIVSDCPNFQNNGTGGASSSSTTTTTTDCAIVTIDHTDEVDGCVPDLQSPDCPAVAAETCVESVCLTDCGDFYLCTSDGWQVVGYCDDDGIFVESSVE